MVIFKAKRPTKNETSMPAKRGNIPISLISAISNFKADAPIIAGMERRKENRPAVSRLIPQKRAQTIVAPDLLMPGMIAAPWTTPMARAERSPMSCLFV